jgi:hypothetical protein
MAGEASSDVASKIQSPREWRGRAKSGVDIEEPPVKERSTLTMPRSISSNQLYPSFLGITRVSSKPDESHSLGVSGVFVEAGNASTSVNAFRTQLGFKGAQARAKVAFVTEP